MTDFEQGASECMNDSRTCTESGAKLAHGCSADVLDYAALAAWQPYPPYPLYLQDLPPAIQPFPVDTLGWLIEQYQTHPMSSFHECRYHTRQGRLGLMKRLQGQYGWFLLSEIGGPEFKRWHARWRGDGKVSIAHAFISQLRTVAGFGIAMLANRECERLALVLSKLKFEQGAPRTEILTAEMAEAHRAKAHEFGWDAMAMAQAFQFELMLRQRDVLGEWVPFSEPGISDVVYPKLGKWGRGLRWEEIDDNLILRHVTSKKQKKIEVDLRNAPMVMAEFSLYCEGKPADQITRADLPRTGPCILNEQTAFPFSANEFRRKWRIVADAVGIPKTVRNQDSRAGAITEATEAGADIEHVKHAATHSDISQTQRYSRGAANKIAGVQQKRLAHRFRTAG
jgi:hypothetical protein